MEYEILYEIKKGQNNTRFLIKDVGEIEKYHSVKLPNDKNYIVGQKINANDFASKIDDVQFKLIWLKNLIEPHLTKYKENVLKIKECGIWEKNNKEYSHVLPKSEMKLNLIDEGYKDKLETTFCEVEKRNAIHEYFAHLNSSQALCFNLFVPIIAEKCFKFIDGNISNNAEAEFEHIEKNSFEKPDNEKEKTNFDFFIQDKTKYFFEVKYTEEKFADTKADERHIKKYEDFYSCRLKEIANELSQEDFFEEYQLWRNICHVKEKDSVVFFVFPRLRTDLEKAVVKAKEKCIEQWRENIKILYVDEIVEELKASDNPKLQKHYTEFYEKYLNISK